MCRLISGCSVHAVVIDVLWTLIRLECFSQTRAFIAALSTKHRASWLLTPVWKLCNTKLRLKRRNLSSNAGTDVTLDLLQFQLIPMQTRFYSISNICAAHQHVPNTQHIRTTKLNYTASMYHITFGCQFKCLNSRDLNHFSLYGLPVFYFSTQKLDSLQISRSQFSLHTYFCCFLLQC